MVMRAGRERARSTHALHLVQEEEAAMRTRSDDVLALAATRASSCASPSDTLSGPGERCPLGINTKHAPSVGEIQRDGVWRETQCKKKSPNILRVIGLMHLPR